MVEVSWLHKLLNCSIWLLKSDWMFAFVLLLPPLLKLSLPVEDVLSSDVFEGHRLLVSGVFGLLEMIAEMS